MENDTRLQLVCIGSALLLQAVALVLKCFFPLSWVLILIPTVLPLALLGAFMVFWMLIGIAEEWGVEYGD